ncbi:hypothetical protein HNQ77_005432 [Silvibacterium bohemicum]|uniref:Uncharacterized protein n=1 Tax=Silvibacterium bohemicum TaxID=1577686 RepID=A0A841K1J6_9BACT|nr:hypothetical protein [Silvibacterium bohemicum]
MPASWLSILGRVKARKRKEESATYTTPINNSMRT